MQVLVGPAILPKLHVLSDLHLEGGDYALPEGLDFDILVAAGDIGTVEEAIAWLSFVGKPVVYVLGNHERYGRDFQEAVVTARRLAIGTQVHVLERNVVVLSGVRFLGATLWTDFGSWHPNLVAHAVERLNDFKEIGAEQWWDSKANRQFAKSMAEKAGVARFEPGVFNPAAAFQEYGKSVSWLKSQLKLSHPGPTVVVSHHAPSFRCLAAAAVEPRCLQPDYWDALDPNLVTVAAYATPLLEHQLRMECLDIDLWVHGHLHYAMDLCVKGTRVVANPRGYLHRPLAPRDKRFLRRFGRLPSADDIRVRAAELRATPYAGNGVGFDRDLVLNFCDGLEPPLTKALVRPLRTLDELIAASESFLPYVSGPESVPTLCVRRAFASNIAAFNEQIVDLLLNEALSVDSSARTADAALYFQPPRPDSARLVAEQFGSIADYAEQVSRMHEWREWVALLPFAAESGLRKWLKQAITGVEGLRQAGIEAKVVLNSRRALKDLASQQLRYRVRGLRVPAKADTVLERCLNGLSAPREYRFDLSHTLVWGTTPNCELNLKQLQACQSGLSAALSPALLPSSYAV